jgi:hypothetical protein
MRDKIFWMALITAAGLISQPAHAALVTFSGTDAGANSTDPRPNANAAAANFSTAASGLGINNLINFESAPTGNFTNLTVAPGVTLTGIDFTGNAGGQSILSSPIGSPDRLNGYNTTAGGANFAFVNGGSITFTFANAINAFGAFLSGVQLANETIKFVDGTTESIAIPNPGSSGGVDFVGFTDEGSLIASITIDSTSPASPLGDFIAIDDIQYVTATNAVPEPATLLSFGMGLIALGSLRRRLQRT